LSQIVPYLTIVAALIGGSVALYIRHKNRSQNAIDEFRIFILSKINEIPSKGFVYFYRLIKPEIGLRVQKLKLFLWWFGRCKIERSWKAFDTIDENSLDDQYEKEEWTEELYKLGNTKPPESPSVILKYYLGKLKKI